MSRCSALWQRHWPLFLFGLGLVLLAGAVVTLRDSQPRLDLTKRAGPFRLLDTTGTPVTEADLQGKPTVVLFGFTTCPDFCPAALVGLDHSMATLGDQANDINFVFITVDPERDKPEALGAYLSSFDARIRGLTGTREAILQAANSFGITFRKVSMPTGGYTFEHPSSLLLYGADGSLADIIPFGASEDERTGRLRSLKPPHAN